MPSPFPGMDPYLEHPEEWPSFHAALIAELGAQLAAMIRPRYIARIEKRVYIEADDDREAVPAVAVYRSKEPAAGALKAALQTRGQSLEVMIEEPLEIEEWSLKIVRVEDRNLVTLIELVSPSNKRPGSEARKLYLKKQRETLASETNWIEIDLLRKGRATIPVGRRSMADYAAFISVAADRPRSRLWPIGLEDRLPILPVPLSEKSESAALDLQAAYDATFDKFGYDLELDYDSDPAPPLTPAQAKWAKKLIKQWKSKRK